MKKDHVHHLYIPVLALVLGAVITGGCSRDPQRAKQNYLHGGMRYLEKGKYQEAIIQFRNALKIDPRFVDAFYQLAQAQLANRDWKNAYASLERASELAPGRSDVRLSLGDLYLAGKAYDRADEQATSVLQKDPTNAGAYQILAMSRVARGQNERALEAFGKLTELQPKAPGPYIDMALAEITLRRFAEAEEHMRKAVEVGPHFPQAYESLAKLYAAEGKLAQSEQVLQAGVENNPDDTSLYLTFANFLYAQQKKDAAEPMLQRLRNRKGKSAPVALAIGDLYFNRQDMDKALAEYRRGLDVDSKNLQLKSRIVQCDLATGRIKEAEAINGQILRTDPKDITAAIAHGGILLAEGKRDEAITELRRRVTEAQDLPQAHYFLALAYWQNHNFPQAKSELGETLRVAPDMVMAQQGLIELHLSLGEIPAARELAEQLVEKHPDNTGGQILLGTACLRQGDFTQAVNHFTIARRLAPSDPAPSFHLAMAYAGQQKWAEAEKRFEEALSIDPRFTPALDQWTNSLARRNQMPQAIARARQYATKYPDNANGHQILGSLLLDGRQYDAARAEFQRAIQLDPKLAQGYARLGDADKAAGRIDAAIQDYERALAVDAKSPLLHSLLGSLYLQQNNPDMAKQHYEQALALDPNFALAANNLAWLYVKQGNNLDVALGWAQKAKEMQPDRVNITDTLGWVEYRKGLYAGSVPLFKECVAKAPEAPTYRYHLGMALLAIGEKNNAKAQLQWALRLKLDGEDAKKAREALEHIN